jgi:arsenical pump membrane protein
MAMTSTAERLGLLERLAALIEPRTRGPVRHAFLVTFVLSALVATVLSNDAAILVMTPTVITLLRTVYPRRHPKFVVAFSLAVFASAGVAPLVISNPMNLIFANHVGIGFNDYALRMVPVALASSVASYVALSWLFRDVLADPAPALGHWTDTAPLSRHGWVVLAVLAASLCCYPVASALDLPLWPVAAAGALVCAGASLASGHSAKTLAQGVTWNVFPFLVGVFLLAIALERVGVVEWLRSLYATRHSVAVIGCTSAVGSALLNNHPMSVLNAFALEGRRDPGHVNALAALVGGDLGPRLTPVGSLASLLWFDLLRRHDVEVKVTTFIRVGVALTIPALAASLLTLWLLS